MSVGIRKAELNELVSPTKTSYNENLAKKLNDPTIQATSYWTILKSFYNNNSKKIPLIPPLLINDKFVTDIKTKAIIFNKLFAEQCTPLKNDSVLPTSQHVQPNQDCTHLTSVLKKYQK